MFLITQNSKWIINGENMGLELERGLMLFFKQIILHLFFCFLSCSFVFDAQRTFVACSQALVAPTIKDLEMSGILKVQGFEV